MAALNHNLTPLLAFTCAVSISHPAALCLLESSEWFRNVMPHIDEDIKRGWKKRRSPWQQGGCAHARQFGSERCARKLEEATPLLVTSGNRGPDAFVVALARLAASALCDAAVDVDRLDSLQFRKPRRVTRHATKAVVERD